MPVEYYRVTDPIENFKIRVIVRETNRPKRDYGTATARNGAYYSFDQVLRWQQKLLGPGDIAEYLVDKTRSRNTNHPVKTNNYLARLEKRGVDVKAMLTESMVFTLIDKDNVAYNKSIGTGYEINRVSTVNYKVMMICLATDINAEDIVNEKWGEYNRYYNTHILCEIRLYENGLMEISPSLSKIIAENSESLQQNPPSGSTSTTNHTVNANIRENQTLSLSLFMDDNTVLKALQDGFLLSSMKVHNLQGAEFEYFIYNTHEILKPHLMNANHYREKYHDMMKVNEQRASMRIASTLSNNTFSSSTGLISYYMMEIISATDFDHDLSNLFVHYQIHLPRKWRLRINHAVNHDGAGGNADTTSINSIDVSKYYNNPSYYTAIFDADLLASRVGVLQGFTHIASSNYSNNSSILNQYYHQVFPNRQARVYNTRKPLSRGLNTFTRVLIGCIFFLTSCIAMALGFTYPWFLFLLVVYYFMFREHSCHLSPSMFIKNYSYQNSYHHYSSHHKKAHYHPISSAVSSLPTQGKQQLPIQRDQVFENQFIFNHNIACSLDVTKDSLLEQAKPLNGGTENITHLNNIYDHAVISFVVFSKAVFDRNIIQGFGHYILPSINDLATDAAGKCHRTLQFDTEITTFKLLGSTRSQMSDFFLGSSQTFKDCHSPHQYHARYLNNILNTSNKAHGSVSRFAHLTKSTGKLRIKGQVIHYDEERHNQMVSMQQQREELPTKSTPSDPLRSSQAISRSATFNKSMLSIKSNASFSIGKDSSIRQKKTVEDIIKAFKLAKATKAGDETEDGQKKAADSNDDTLSTAAVKARRILNALKPSAISSSIGIGNPLLSAAIQASASNKSSNADAKSSTSKPSVKEILENLNASRGKSTAKSKNTATSPPHPNQPVPAAISAISQKLREKERENAKKHLTADTDDEDESTSLLAKNNREDKNNLDDDLRPNRAIGGFHAADSKQNIAGEIIPTEEIESLLGGPRGDDDTAGHVTDNDAIISEQTGQENELSIGISKKRNILHQAKLLPNSRYHEDDQVIENKQVSTEKSV